MDNSTRQRSNSQLTYKRNEQLRRENKRLRKQIQKLNGAINSLSNRLEEDSMDLVELEREPPKPISTEPCCPTCHDELKQIEFGVYLYLICSGCKYREKRTGTVNK